MASTAPNDGDHSRACCGSSRWPPRMARATRKVKCRRSLFRSAISADFDESRWIRSKLHPETQGRRRADEWQRPPDRWARTSRASAELAAARIDLDELAGAQAGKLLRDGGGLGLADSLLSAVARTRRSQGHAQGVLAESRRRSCENVVMRVEAGSEAIRVRELSASLPGRSTCAVQRRVLSGQEVVPNWRAAWRSNRTICGN